MGKRGTYVQQATTLAIAFSCIALSSIGGADSVVAKRAGNIADQELFFAPVPKAVCGPGDKPETGLQGQVPAALRAAGFQGFSCNLQLLAQVKGEGANWQTAEWREGKGKTKRVCAYHGTAAPTASTLPRTQLGVRAIDITDPTKPVTTAYLTSTAMLDPWESLKTNERRQLLADVNGANGSGGPEFDVYDVSGDCRYPQLLSSTAMTDPALGFPAFRGHEGNWAPDGLTYYSAAVTSTPGQTGRPYYAIDATDTTKPKLIASFALPFAPTAIGHGLSVSDDGTRGYITSDARLATPAISDPSAPATNGLVIYDLSDIQARKPNPTAKVISELYWKDGGGGQSTIHVMIKGKPYVIYNDESGTAGLAIACGLGMNPFPLARIIDISDERNPKVISKVMHEIHDPANCDKVTPDLVGENSFTYGTHYCSVDNRNNATTLACGQFFSGIRVYDIRDPIRPREIAYYNPAGATTVSPGSNRGSRGWYAGSPDWCTAQLHLDAEQGTLWTTCHDNGLLSLKFTHNAWPFADSTTPAGMQN